MGVVMAISDRTRSNAPIDIRLARPPAGQHEHVVEFYETTEFLVDTVCDFVGPTLHDGGAAIIVASAAHRAAFETALRDAGVDVEQAIAADRYMSFDAAELLADLIIDGMPHPGRFREAIGEVIDRAGAKQRRVRVYGEMVALLWEDGDIPAAVALEDLWNELAATHDFALLCAYPIRAFTDDATAAAFERVCDQHSTVIPCESYTRLGSVDAKRREVARLQRENAVLRADARRLHAEHKAIARNRRADDLCAATMHTIAEGLVALDAEGRLTYMNGAAERMLGWTEEELLGHPIENLIHRRRPDDAQPSAADSPLASVFREQRTVRSREDSLVRRDGRILPVMCSASPEPGGGVVIAFADVTEEIEARRRAERKLEAFAWVSRVREAIEEDRLVLHSQPILPLRGGAAREELLLRMVSREGEVVSAGAFLPAAEELGLIFEIDSWVIARAVRFAALGRIVQVNLSAASMADTRLLEHVARQLAIVGAPAGNVVFEIGEAALMSDPTVGQAFAARLVDLGCGLALDDFGTGSGSFAYLQELSVQALKIDIDFVRDLPGSPANQHLIQAIVALARSFGTETIAGGVEDRETLALLREFGVDYAQGYAIDDLSTVVQRVVPPPSVADHAATAPTPLRPTSDRARLLRGRLLDHREAQRTAHALAAGL
jgi:PAS domain S-box-containing protein